MKRFLVGLIIFGIFFSPTRTFAAHTLEISSDKTTLTHDDQATVSLSFSGFTFGDTVYVKGAFFTDGSTNYFGLSQYKDAWIKNSSSAMSQPLLTIGSSSATLVVKSDPSDTGFHGEGEYKLKVGYYYLTSGGNLSSVNWSENTVSMHLSAPLPTNTPTSTSFPTIPPSPTILAETVTEESVYEPREESLAGKEGEELNDEQTTAVLGESISNTPAPSPPLVKVQELYTSPSHTPVFVGFGSLVVCAILICRKRWNMKFPFEH